MIGLFMALTNSGIDVGSCHADFSRPESLMYPPSPNVLCKSNAIKFVRFMVVSWANGLFRVRETAYPIYGPALLTSSVELFCVFCSEMGMSLSFLGDLISAPCSISAPCAPTANDEQLPMVWPARNRYIDIIMESAILRHTPVV